MKSSGRSLRNLVDKWLAPTPGSPISLSRLTFARPGTLRCVRVEATGVSEPRAIFFFRHGDGSWCVFPPAFERPAMRAHMTDERGDAFVGTVAGR